MSLGALKSARIRRRRGTMGRCFMANSRATSICPGVASSFRALRAAELRIQELGIWSAWIRPDADAGGGVGARDAGCPDGPVGEREDEHLHGGAAVPRWHWWQRSRPADIDRARLGPVRETPERFHRGMTRISAVKSRGRERLLTRTCSALTRRIDRPDGR